MYNINIKLWYDKYFSINVKYLILLVLAGLHYHKKISDEKLKGQFQSLRKGTLEKYKKTYHCDINDQWYNDKTAYEIFKDCIVDKDLSLIPFVTFIEYISLFENKGYNHALNVFGSQYIYPLFNSWNPEYTDSPFADYIEFYIPNIYVIKNESYCSECDHYHVTYNKNIQGNIANINDWLHNQKKGNLAKIPKHDISKGRFWI